MAVTLQWVVKLHGKRRDKMGKYVYVHDCTANPILTTAYTEIESSTQQDCSYVQFFYFKQDSSFGLVALGIGAESEEIDTVVCSQKVGTPINCYIQNSSRLSLKALTSNVTTGYIVVCLLS